MPDAIPLPSDRHALYRLSDGLLLVFKPRHHREPEHVHPHAQRLRVLRGVLAVERSAGPVVLDASGDTVVIPAGEAHATVAREDVWLVVETRA